MTFKVTEDTVVRPHRDGSGIQIVSGPGGSPWVTDPKRPHLGGNFDGGDLGTMYQQDLWPWLVDSFDIKTMADVGCGTGETMSWFDGRGVKTLGVDGLPWNIEQAGKRCSAKLVLHDFTEKGPCVFDAVDLIWCADTVEHIDEAHVDDVLTTLRQCKVLAMCQGTEEHDASGWNHVNNKPEAYWVEKLAAVGMIEDEALTVKSREVGDHGWWSFTGRIYVHEGIDLGEGRVKALAHKKPQAVVAAK